MDLDIRHLQLVAGIADAGSMTKAAAGLQPDPVGAQPSAARHRGAASTRRSSCGVGKRMVLTAAGRRVLESATASSTTSAALKRTSGGSRSTATASSAWRPQCNTGYHWLPPLLATFNRKHPRVTVSIMPDTTDRPVQALLDGRLDLAILTDEVSDRRLRLRPLFTDEMVAIVSRDHRSPGAAGCRRAHWRPSTCCCTRARPKRASCCAGCWRLRRLVPARVSFIMLTEAMIEMARAGLGVGVLPRWSAQPAIAHASVVPLSITRRGVRRHWTRGDAEGAGRAALADRLHRSRSPSAPCRRAGPPPGVATA